MGDQKVPDHGGKALDDGGDQFASTVGTITQASATWAV